MKRLSIILGILIIPSLVFAQFERAASTSNEGSVAEGEASTAKPLAIGGIAETTVKDAVEDGDAVGIDITEYGRQVFYGANKSVGAVDVNVIAPVPIRDGCNHLLDVTVDANGESFDGEMFIGDANKLAVLVWNVETASADDSQVDVTIELSPDGSAYMDAETTMINSEDSAVAAAGDWTFDTTEERYFWFPAGAGITAKNLKATVTCDANCDGSDKHAFDMWVCTNN